MSRIVYVNGRYQPYGEAAVHVEDRGFQFGDAVYEVCPVDAGRIVDEQRHLARLARSLSELRIAMPMSPGAFGVVFREVVRRNRVYTGMIYLQVSRGQAPRDFMFPHPDTPPTVVVLARSTKHSDHQALTGIEVLTVPDERWSRVDIKTVQLLAPVLAKQKAKEAGAKEAWMVDQDGHVTEGASSNAWIVTAEGDLVTRDAERGILRGITRTVLTEVAAAEGVRFVERRFTVAEALAAREAFVTSATNYVMPVVRVDGRPVGDGKPGSLTLRMRRSFLESADYTR
jgi:D-alanine transaminase